MAKGSGGTRTSRPASVDYSSKQAAYDALVERTGEIWNSLSYDEKDILWNFTGNSYYPVNKAAETGVYDKDYREQEIKDMTSAINKSSYKQDIVLRRGTSSFDDKYLGWN